MTGLLPFDNVAHKKRGTECAILNVQAPQPIAIGGIQAADRAPEHVEAGR